MTKSKTRLSMTIWAKLNKHMFMSSITKSFNEQSGPNVLISFDVKIRKKMQFT